MKTKLLAMMLLAGGSIFAQPRFSVGVGVGGYGGGVYQQPLPYGYGVPQCPPYYVWDNAYGTCVQDYAYAQPYFYGGYRGGYNFGPRFDNRFDNRGGVTRGFAPDRNRGGGQNFNGNQSRGFSQGQTGGNRGGSGGQRSGGQGSRNGSRGR